MNGITKAYQRQRPTLRQFGRDERGVTGLETAIILIAFVVVASVFAFTVLSTGIFSAERGKETIHAGLQQSRSSVELKGSVVANGVAKKVLSSANTTWTTANTASTTIANDTTDKKVGTASADLTVASTFTTGLVAYENASSTFDLSSLQSVKFWAKAASSTTANYYELVLDDTAGCGSPLEGIGIPVLTAATWKQVTLSITDNSDMTAVKCVGLKIRTDEGTNVINIDNVVAQGQATTILVTLANALEGEPVDMTEPGDADADGLSDSDSDHTMIATYTDKDQVARDIYWTSTFIGQNDSDDLLESGEKVELSLTLSGISGSASSSPVVGETKWDIELRAAGGGSVVIERTMPDLIDLVMNLN